jgi:hypothetical protein
MKRVTLNGIKRRGLAKRKGREWWALQTVSILSREHIAWWRPEGKGYTFDQAEAMVVDFPTAYDHTKHCRPEKQIVFYALSVACTGCGSMKSIEQIRGDHPDALSCCPEPTCTRKPPVNELIPQDTNHD